MNVSQLKEFCRGFPSATETLYEEPYNFLVYAVGGNKFAYFKTSHPEDGVSAREFHLIALLS